MIWNQENFTAKPWLYQQIQDGDIFLGGHLLSEVEDDLVISDKKNLKFYNANLINLVLHPSCKVFRGNSAKQEWVYVDPADITKGKKPMNKGKREHTKMTPEDIDQVLADDELTDVAFYTLNKMKIKKARVNLGKPEKPPKIPMEVA